MLAIGLAFVTGTVHLPIRCEGPSPNWDTDKPFGANGIQVADLAEAAPYLAFAPVVPRGLGQPSKFFVNGNKPDRSARNLLWVYHQPPYGRFWVTEEVTEVTQAWIDSRTNNPTGCSIDSVVKLRDGTRAALSVANPAASGSGASTTSITWLDQGLMISALGPTDTFTKDRAIEVANATGQGLTFDSGRGSSAPDGARQIVLEPEEVIAAITAP